MVRFCSAISVVLLNAPEIFMCHNNLCLSSPFSDSPKVVSVICLFPMFIHWLVRKPSCGPNVSNHFRSRGRGFISTNIS